MIEQRFEMGHRKGEGAGALVTLSTSAQARGGIDTESKEKTLL